MLYYADNGGAQMPLTPQDRQFLQVVDHLKIYILLTALAIFLYLLVVPANEIRMATSVLAITLCAVFWLTQRLLSFITLLDLELSRIVNVLKRTLPEEQQKSLFS